VIGKDIKEGENPRLISIVAAINKYLVKECVKKKVVFLNKKEFISAIIQSHYKKRMYFILRHLREVKTVSLFNFYFILPLIPIFRLYIKNQFKGTAF